MRSHSRSQFERCCGAMRREWCTHAMNVVFIFARMSHEHAGQFEQLSDGASSEHAFTTERHARDAKRGDAGESVKPQNIEIEINTVRTNCVTYVSEALHFHSIYAECYSASTQFGALFRLSTLDSRPTSCTWFKMHVLPLSNVMFSGRWVTHSPFLSESHIFRSESTVPHPFSH